MFTCHSRSRETSPKMYVVELGLLLFIRSSRDLHREAMTIAQTYRALIANVIPREHIKYVKLLHSNIACHCAFFAIADYRCCTNLPSATKIYVFSALYPGIRNGNHDSIQSLDGHLVEQEHALL
jgi:hypothetical protein